MAATNLVFLRFTPPLQTRGGPYMTTVLAFEPGEAAQVDFGEGPEVVDRRTGELLGTWIFVMTLAWSRHAYAEVVTDQKVATWLGCHRRALGHSYGAVRVKRKLTFEYTLLFSLDSSTSFS